MIMVEDHEYDSMIEDIKQRDRLLAHNMALQAHLMTVVAIKDALANDDPVGAAQALANLSEDTYTALWLATTKGGIFTTREREQIRGLTATPKEQI